MKIRSITLKSLLTATLIASAGTISTGVMADSAATSGSATQKKVGFQTLCQSYGGQFNSSWLYNDQGTKWGQIETCATPTGTLTCQGGVCRSDRQANVALQQTAASADPLKSQSADQPFRAETPEIIRALASLTAQ